MKRSYAFFAVNVIAAIEIAIGSSAFVGSILSGYLFSISKPLNVLMFVMATAVLSAALGCGLLMRREWSRRALVYFSGYIVLMKILIFAGILTLSGEIMTIMPAWVKDAISVAYHMFIMIILQADEVKRVFR